MTIEGIISTGRIDATASDNAKGWRGDPRYTRVTSRWGSNGGERGRGHREVIARTIIRWRLRNSLVFARNTPGGGGPPPSPPPPKRSRALVSSRRTEFRKSVIDRSRASARATVRSLRSHRGPTIYVWSRVPTTAEARGASTHLLALSPRDAYAPQRTVRLVVVLSSCFPPPPECQASTSTRGEIIGS